MTCNAMFHGHQVTNNKSWFFWGSSTSPTFQVNLTRTQVNLNIDVGRHLNSQSSFLWTTQWYFNNNYYCPRRAANEQRKRCTHTHTHKRHCGFKSQKTKNQLQSRYVVFPHFISSTKTEIKRSTVYEDKFCKRILPERIKACQSI